MTEFSSLGLAAPLLRALATEGYKTPTPIQAQAIPPVMAGRDLLGIAQTGTGKTAAFALPILHRLSLDPKPAPRLGCRVLVLSPTRELASQIADSFRTYGRHFGFSVAVIFGGVKYGAQIKAMARGVDILVATPGRLIDHMGQRTVNLGSTEILVLDEADQMLDLGFLQPIRRIVATLSKNRQSLFFSATMPTEIGKLAAEMLRDPQRVAVTPVATTVEKVRQRMIFVEADRKRELLAELFDDERMERTIVFTKTKRGADRVAKSLEAAGVTATSIHGDKSQGQRERALAAFKAGETRALVATDIAARGIDIDAVSHVVNYELPFVPEAYVHRIGRTARAGASGQAISLCADDERPLARDIEKLIRQSIETTDRRRDPGLAIMAKARAAEAPEPRQSRPSGQRPSGQRPGAKADAPRLTAQPLKSRGRRRRGGGGGKPSFGGGGRSSAPQPRASSNRSFRGAAGAAGGAGPSARLSRNSADSARQFSIGRDGSIGLAGLPSAKAAQASIRRLSSAHRAVKSRSVHRWMLGVDHHGSGSARVSGIRPCSSRSSRTRQWPKFGSETIACSPIRNSSASTCLGRCTCCSVCERMA